MAAGRIVSVRHAFNEALRMTSPDDYAALHEDAVIGAIAPRGQIAVAGPDRATFLQGFLTNDTAALSAGHGFYAAWLTPQGRMLCDLHVLESGDMILLRRPGSGPHPDGRTSRAVSFHRGRADCSSPARFAAYGMSRPRGAAST